MTWNRGKGLGGSSNINQLAWTRPSPNEIDAWERLGNQGWSYNDLLPYMEKVENFRAPSDDTVKAKLLAGDQPWFGKNGRIPIAFCEVLTGMEEVIRTVSLWFYSSSFPKPLCISIRLKSRGIPVINNAPLGEYTGLWNCPSSVDSEKLERSTAFKGYIHPYLNRENLFILPEAYVTKLVWKDPKSNMDEEATAKGVEFIHGGKTFMVNSAREVLLTAGALKTPQLLELSGIGSRTVLEPLGIHVLVDLPGVGENLQDHYAANTVVWELNHNNSYRTLDLLMDPVENKKYEELHKQKQHGLLSWTTTDLLFASLQSLSPNAEKLIALHEKDLANRMASIDTDDDAMKGLKEQLDIQLERLRNSTSPMIELIFPPIFLDFSNVPEQGKMYLSVLITLVGTWTRGTAHISSTDPLKSPDYDGNAFAYQFERDAFTEAVKFTRQLKDCEPLKSIIAKEIAPGDKVVTDEEIHERTKATFNTFWHACGTASMLPREKRGVVDPNLKVYGTTNVRVCDISIVPLQGHMHTQCVTYAIAEKAADIILKCV